MTDSVLRVYADTRFIIVQNLLKLAVIAVMIGPLLAHFGLLGAVLATLLAAFSAKVAAVFRVRQLMHSNWRRVLPWWSLMKILAIATAAAAPAWMLKSSLTFHALPAAFAIGATYAAAYGAAIWVWGPLRDSERTVLLHWIQGPFARLGRIGRT